MDIFKATMAATLLAADEGDKDGEPVGRIKALVSAYDVEYTIGWRMKHTIKAGAFKEYMGASIPFYIDHDWGAGNPPFGEAIASDSKEGLVVTVDMYVDEDPAVARLYRAIKAGTVNEYSIGYKPVDWKVADADDDDDYERQAITKAELLEASSVLRGANPATKTLAASAQQGPDGHAQLMEAIRAGVYDDVLASRLTHSTVTKPQQQNLEPEPVSLDRLMAARLI